MQKKYRKTTEKFWNFWTVPDVLFVYGRFDQKNISWQFYQLATNLRQVGVASVLEILFFVSELHWSTTTILVWIVCSFLEIIQYFGISIAWIKYDRLSRLWNFVLFHITGVKRTMDLVNQYNSKSPGMYIFYLLRCFRLQMLKIGSVFWLHKFFIGLKSALF